jgi:hypothetical protein
VRATLWYGLSFNTLCSKFVEQILQQISAKHVFDSTRFCFSWCAFFCCWNPSGARGSSLSVHNAGSSFWWSASAWLSGRVWWIPATSTLSQTLSHRYSYKPYHVMARGNRLVKTPPLTPPCNPLSRPRHIILSIKWAGLTVEELKWVSPIEYTVKNYIRYGCWKNIRPNTQSNGN